MNNDEMYARSLKSFDKVTKRTKMRWPAKHQDKGGIVRVKLVMPNPCRVLPEERQLWDDEYADMVDVGIKVAIAMAKRGH